MENYTLDHDMSIMYVTATSFPAGIIDAFDRLRKQVEVKDARDFFGISHMSPEGIIYKAWVEQKEEWEAEKYGCELYTMKAGEYYVEKIGDWKKVMPQIGIAFQSLIKQPDIDLQGACIEWYDEHGGVMCMVKKNAVA